MSDETELLFSFDWCSTIPTEIRLFGEGVNSTRKGDFVFDEQAARDVMAAFADSGVDRLPFDVAHGMVNPAAPPDSHKALGWFVPEVKDDVENGGGMALFASDIQWTEAGSEALQKREFRFYSPAITYDPDTRRITSLINCALTNIPATKGQKPLVLDGVGENEKKETQDMKVLLDALGVSDESAAVERVAELSAIGKQKDDKIAELSAAVESREKELDAIKAEVAAKARDAEIAELSAAGKLPPAQHDFARSLDSEQFKAFTATLSVVVPDKVEQKPVSDKVETLSDDERKSAALIAEQLGLSVDDVLEDK